MLARILSFAAIAAMLLVTTAQAALWTFDSVEVIDESVGTTTYPDLVSTSLAFDSVGNPHVSYWRPDGSDLRYATKIAGAWSATTVDSGYWGEAGWSSNLALDANDYPWIVYGHQGFYIMFLRFNGTSWSARTPVDPGIMGDGEASLALGSDDLMHLSYYTLNTSPGGTAWGLQYGLFSGTYFTPSERVNDSLYYTGYNSALALDSEGYPHIAYWHNYSSGPHDLRYSKKDATGWHHEQLDTPGVGQYVDMVLDSLNHPHVAYWDQTNNAIKYMEHDGSSWSTPEVLAENAGANVSLVLDANDEPLVVFRHDGGLALARRVAGVWQVDMLATEENTVLGESADIAIDGDGWLGVTFYDETNGRILYGRIDRCADVVCPEAIDDCHDVGTCDRWTGLCSNPEVPDGTACDDGNSCTTDTCVAGECQGLDTTPPVVTCAVTKSSLWSPDHTLKAVGLTSTASDQCDGSRAVTVTVFGDENDETPTGDGTLFSPDAKNIAPGTLRLRNERVSNANGRVYLVVPHATDTTGNTGVACCSVVVPKSSKAVDIASANAQASAARSYCIANDGARPPSYFNIGDGPTIGSK